MVLDNRPILVMGPGGRLLPSNMAVARITEDDLRATLRSANVHNLTQVQAVIMEGTGDIHVLRSDSDAPVDRWLLQGVRDYEPRGGLDAVCRPAER
nr:YetF domain-containing protein [Rhodovibrio sodomensis]